MADPPAPPVETGDGVRLPTIERITPPLAGRAEVVRRDTSDRHRLTQIIELKQPRVRPYVGAVVRHEDRRIAEHPYAFCMRILAQGLPLTVETPLHEPTGVELSRQAAAGAGHRERLACSQSVRPRRPTAAGLRGGERRVKRVVLQPARLLVAEPPVLHPCRGIRAAREPVGRKGEPLHAPGDDRRVVHPVGGGRRTVFDLGSRQPTTLMKIAKIDEQRMTCERRWTHVRGVAGAGGAERQHLPQPLARRGQPVDELIRACAEVAATMRTR